MVEPKVTWLASYPRSGNTWLRYLLYSYLVNPAESMRDSGKISAALQPLLQVQEKSNRPEAFFWNRVYHFWKNYEYNIDVADNLFVKTHTPFHPKYPLRNKTGRIVLLIRNPKDVFLSLYNYRINGENFNQPPDEYFLDYIKNGGDKDWLKQYGSWLGFFESWVSTGLDCDICIIKYEDMLEKPMAEFVRLLKFLNIEVDENRVKVAVEACEISRLRKIEQKAIAENKEDETSNTWFFNKGISNQKIGSEFGERSNELFDERFEHLWMAIQKRVEDMSNL